MNQGDRRMAPNVVGESQATLLLLALRLRRFVNQAVLAVLAAFARPSRGRSTADQLKEARARGLVGRSGSWLLLALLGCGLLTSAILTSHNIVLNAARRLGGDVPRAPFFLSSPELRSLIQFEV